MIDLRDVAQVGPAILDLDRSRSDQTTGQSPARTTRPRFRCRMGEKCLMACMFRCVSPSENIGAAAMDDALTTVDCQYHQMDTFAVSEVDDAQKRAYDLEDAVISNDFKRPPY